MDPFLPEVLRGVRYFLISAHEANPMGAAESGDLKNWTQFWITLNQARRHVVIAVF